MSPDPVTHAATVLGDSAKWLAALAQVAGNIAAGQAVLARFGLDRQALLQLAPPMAPHQPYNRLILGQNADCEVMLARWTPTVRCAPHDHGEASGWVWFLRGTFAETAWTRQSGHWLAGTPIVHAEGATTAVRRALIHDCACDGDGVSLHVYQPAIRGMQVLDVAGQRTVTVADHCGAWLPAQESDWQRITRW